MSKTVNTLWEMVHHLESNPRAEAVDDQGEVFRVEDEGSALRGLVGSEGSTLVAFPVTLLSTSEEAP